MSVDWTKVERDYVCSTATVRDLAKKYGVSYQSVSHHCHKEGWLEKRQNQAIKTTKKFEEKKAEADSDTALDTMQRVAKGMDAEIDRIMTQLENPDLPVVSRSYLVKSLEIAIRLCKDAKGILSQADKIKLDSARAELKIKQLEIKNLESAETADKTIKVEISEDLKELAK